MTVGEKRPRIGDRAAWSDERGILFRGVIQDLRPNAEGTWVAYIATLGWPEMARVAVDGYDWQEEDGTWRGCLHLDGVDAAGSCFRCRDRFVRRANEVGAIYG